MVPRAGERVQVSMDELHLHFMGQGLDQGVAEGAK